MWKSLVCNLRIVCVLLYMLFFIFNFRYVLQLQHGPYQWVVKRRYKHFLHLHQQLRIFKASLAIPLPTKKQVYVLVYPLGFFL